jgi:hypothetical protein
VRIEDGRDAVARFENAMTQSIGAGLKKVQNGTEWHPLVQYQKQPR